ncbi:hypothetical protein AX774_g1238 [Zancudomyces culisetae]|uniref:Uncharacterized protein n=1 Tax=Zancudomyces culisetae TaxID=1213189 RepID=A0A1R1PWB7_ZANCU|nr:hypothetical protein AX774_g1238 [Zancudomyces culisetae]|eukprot:OMH85214.1 hypothetical protein AX774_g1238 [Zancudomyces culisetae]
MFISECCTIEWASKNIDKSAIEKLKLEGWSRMDNINQPTQLSGIFQHVSLEFSSLTQPYPALGQMKSHRYKQPNLYDNLI